MHAGAQVTVTLQVEQSRRACDAVARGEADCAIIGGDVPEDLEAILQVCLQALPAMDYMSQPYLHPTASFGYSTRFLCSCSLVESGFSRR